MRTDKELFRIFQLVPDWLFELTGLPSPGRSVFRSVVLKELERRADGVNVPEDEQQPITVVEMQFQRDDGIYTRVVTEMALLQQENSGRPIRGLILFRDPSLDPQTRPWTQVVQSFMFDDMLRKLDQEQPHHPLVAVFRPVFVNDPQTLEKHAVEYYRDISESSLTEQLKNALVEVFISWLLQRLHDKGREEIEAMILGELPSLEETKAGKELIALGEERGEQRGEQRGIHMGELNALRQAVIVLLESRSISISDDLRQKIMALDRSAAFNLLPLAPTWNTATELEDWLAKNTPS